MATTSNEEEEEARLRGLIDADDLALANLTYEDLGIDPVVEDYLPLFVAPDQFDYSSNSRGGGGRRGRGRGRPRQMQVPTVGLRTPPHAQDDPQPVPIVNEGLDDLQDDDAAADGGGGANAGGVGGGNGGGGGDGGAAAAAGGNGGGDGGGGGGGGGDGGGGGGGGGGGDGGGGGGGGGGGDGGGGDGGGDGGDEFDQMNDPNDNEYHEPFRYFRTRRGEEADSIVEYRTVVVSYKNRNRPVVLPARRERRIRPEKRAAAAAAQRGRRIGYRLLRGHRGSRYRVQRGWGRHRLQRGTSRTRLQRGRQRRRWRWESQGVAVVWGREWWWGRKVTTVIVAVYCRNGTGYKNSSSAYVILRKRGRLGL